eukprot:XP_011612058.1 PREDICTED: calcium-binding and coiled-coil domain-containing protein 1-like [Takifugu rubripes]
MDKQPTVVFRNVGQLYFPQTRVECHYSLTPDHQWNSSDWVGIFQLGSSVKRYHTYTWALVPEGHTDGNSANCCVVFHASYLPQPGAVRYEFRYVDKVGQVCARSPPFTFCLPKPLEELETLKEEEDEEDGEEELLLVVPRAQLLQSRLEECLKRQVEVQQALDVTEKEVEKEKENSGRARGEWERERDAMREVISKLRDGMRENYEKLKKMEGKHEDVKYSRENLTSELTTLMAERAESQQRIRDLEEENKVLRQGEREGKMEIDRLKERLKKTSSQMKHDEEKKKTLQAETEAALQEARGLQERLEVSEHLAEGLRRELRELGARQGYTHTELHQARLQVAQLTLQLSEEDLLLREERANWALEREAYKHGAESDKKKIQELSCEVQRKEEWLQEERREREKLEAELGSDRECNRVLLSDARRELQELKSSLRKVQREREEQADKKERLNSGPWSVLGSGTGPEVDSSGGAPSPGCSSVDEEGCSSASPRSIDSPLFSSADPEQPGAPETCAETRIVDKEDAFTAGTQDEDAAGDGKTLDFPQRVDFILSELADSPMW